MRTAMPLLLLALAQVGCGAPMLSATFAYPLRYAGPAPQVRIAPIQDPRPDPLHVTVGYAGLFQTRQEQEANEDTPPAAVVTQALQADLGTRGLAPGDGGYRVDCQLPLFLIRYRNYAGMLSSTDAWGYMDLVCTVQASGALVWQGPIYARAHQVFYAAGVDSGVLENDLWPTITGILVQQAATALNRVAFHQAPAPAVASELQGLLSSRDVDARVQALYALGIAGDHAAVPALLEAAADGEVKIRRAAVDALGTMGAAQALPTLLSRYAREEGSVQWMILKAILQVGDPAGFAWLRRNRSAIDAETLIEIADDVLGHPVPAAAPAPPVVSAPPSPPAVPAPPPPPAVPAT